MKESFFFPKPLHLEDHTVFAVCSDIHANAIAFKAVLSKINALEQAWGIKIPLIANGDSLDTGPEPVETLALLAENNILCLRGNHEEYLIDYANTPLLEKYQAPLWKFIPWTVKKVGADALRERLSPFPFSHRSEDGFLNFVHASRENIGKVPKFFGPQKERIAPAPQPIVMECEHLYFCGHSHYFGHYWEPNSANLWINTGSVGYPFLRTLSGNGTRPSATFVLGFYTKKVFHKMRRAKIYFVEAPYSGEDLVESYINSGALEDCAPFSMAVLAQSLLNEDLVFPAFQIARQKKISNHALPDFILAYLRSKDCPKRLAHFCKETAHFTLLEQLFKVESWVKS